MRIAALNPGRRTKRVHQIEGGDIAGVVRGEPGAKIAARNSSTVTMKATMVIGDRLKL